MHCIKIKGVCEIEVLNELQFFMPLIPLALIPHRVEQKTYTKVRNFAVIA